MDKARVSKIFSGKIGALSPFSPFSSRRFTFSDGGFTLLELLISMTLLVVIVAITMGAMSMGSRSVASGERKMDAQERFRTVLSLMDAQIQSQVPLTYEVDGKKRYYFSGDGKNLRFSTNYSIWGGQRGYVIVDYTVKADNTGKEVLYAGEQVPGIEGRRDIRLIEATGISFQYFHKDRSEEQGKWLEMLSGESFVPEKVKVHIVEGTKKLFLVFSVRVGGEMTTVGTRRP
jgi:prepilin-type N-terminal cleavage/methylation domain-containing protein